MEEKEDLLTCKKKIEFYESILSALPYDIFAIDEKETAIYYNHSISHSESSLGELVRLVYPISRTFLEKENKVIVSQIPLLKDERVLGAVEVRRYIEEGEEVLQQLDSYKNLSNDLQAIFDTAYDVIYVSNGEGITLRVSSACEELWGYKEQELVGKSVYELEKAGVFMPSVTRLVLEKGEKVSTVQTTKTGRRLMVVGTPIKNEAGEITRVVNASRDITEVSKLQNELDVMKRQLAGYKKEIKQLKEMQGNSIVYRSPEMDNIMTLAGKLAEVDSAVLILGESGVGKEVIASHIHLLSNRKDKPYIKINCGAIPETLLESELFGYEKGAFTGASKDGKPGLFELANDGTLFLDEIGELPFSLQVKLLRVLQEKELVRIGGSKPVKIDVRIIAATNRDLFAEVQSGRFREDLYYRLNVVPVHIPPLRERKEDILPLIIHFVDKFNEKHKKNKVFSNTVLEYLQIYHWPGNVRELQNIIERLIVIVDQDVVETKHIPDSLMPKNKTDAKIVVSDILPLKEALELVESQLIELARERYKTTTQIAKALGVNQSTISRKIIKRKIK